MTTDPTRETLWISDDVHLTVERAARIVRFTRTSRSLPEMPALLAAFEALFAALDRLPRAEYGLLIDLRAAVGRADDDFEAAMHTLRPRLIAGFRRAAVLVRSAVGKLQIQRLSRADGTVDRVIVTTDEAEAIAHVAAPAR